MESEDVREAERAALLTLFNSSPTDFAWSTATCDHIESRRAQMNDQLIFDVLLTTGGILNPDRLYPPRDMNGLIVLMDAILDSTYDLLKKDCLIYYLMQFHKDGREEIFSEEHSIPPQFVLLADAYWQLDNGADVPRAVSILSDLRLNRDYPSKIFQAISLAENANPLILKYVRTAKPILTEPMDIELFTVALAESSLLDAWQYQRTFPEISGMRPRLVYKILQWCLTPQPRPEPLTQLLGSPFSPYEEKLIHEYALQPPSSLPSYAWPVIQDLICVRLIQSGSYASAIKLDRQFAANVIPSMTPKMEKAIQERRAMVDELLATLPAVERSMLQADMEADANGETVVGPSFYDRSPDRQDLTMSWEDVPSPSAAIEITAPPSQITPKDFSVYGTAPTSISARNDLPRFGTSISTNSNTFMTISTSTSSSHQARGAFTPFSSTNTSLALSQGTRVPAPLLGSSGIKYPTPLVSHPGSSTSIRNPPGASKPPSLFTLGGSANQTRNAFYTPPTTNGVKRALVEDEPRALSAPNPGDAPPLPVVNNDVHMETDDEDVPVANSSKAANANATPAELSYSVFGGNPSLPKQPPLKTRRVGKAEPTQKVHMPPGAFHADDDEAPAPTAERSPSRSRTVSPAPPPARSKQKATRKSTSRKREDHLTRSVPGAFVDDDHEEEDYVAPLPGSPPPNKRTIAKKPRASRSAASEDDDPPRATRRSTRLTAASSVASTSPEPSPPPKKTITKGRKSTRTSSKK